MNAAGLPLRNWRSRMRWRVRAPCPPGLISRLEELNESNKALAERLQELQTQNRQWAQVQGFEDVRALAERQARAGEPFDTTSAAAGASAGRGGCRGGAEWRSGGRYAARAGRAAALAGRGRGCCPVPALVMMQSGQAKRALAASLLLLVVLLVAWIVSCFPEVLAWVRAFWPEQMALLGLLGWQTLGLNLVVVFVILLGVCARLIVLVQVGVSLLLLAAGRRSRRRGAGRFRVRSPYKGR